MSSFHPLTILQFDNINFKLKERCWVQRSTKNAPNYNHISIQESNDTHKQNGKHQKKTCENTKCKIKNEWAQLQKRGIKLFIFWMLETFLISLQIQMSMATKLQNFFVMLQD